MMLATLHGNRTNKMGCSGCSGGCLNGTECKDLAILSGWWSDVTDAVGDAGKSIVSTVSNVASAALDPMKATLSTIKDLGTGNFSQALKDSTRIVSASIAGPAKMLAATVSNVPGLSSIYPAVDKFSDHHSEAITLAAAVVAATVLTAGVASPGLFSVVGIAPADTVLGVTAGDIGAAVSTGATTVAVGEKLLNSGKLNPTQTQQVTTAISAVKADPNYVPPSNGGWMLFLAPLLAFL